MRPDLDLPRVVCEYEDVFPDELPGLPPQRMVDSESSYRSYWTRGSLD